jgi:hypothetical protein
LRGKGECHKCHKFTKEIEKTPLDLLLKDLSKECKPKISKENMIDLAKLDMLLSQREEIQDSIDCLEKHMGIFP